MLCEVRKVSAIIIDNSSIYSNDVELDKKLAEETTVPVEVLL